VQILGQSIGSREDAMAVVRHAQSEKPAWLAVDGYDFKQPYLEALAASATPILLAVDFVQAENLPAAIVLNQNPHACTEDYAARAPGAELLLGLRYLLLRREFRAWSSRRPARSGKVLQLLVTMGGADPENATERIVRALAGRLAPGIRVKVLIGANNLHAAGIRAAVAQAGPSFACLERVADMPELLNESDLAICGAGTTCWEMAFFGVPALTVILADNQAPLAAALERLGGGINLGWFEKLNLPALGERVNELASDEPRVAKLARCGQALIDGGGAVRVVETMRNSPRASRLVQTSFHSAS
jgi:spore coat polysaccharide biosynthesis predicted glycosyltransferase SpsG